MNYAKDNKQKQPLLHYTPLFASLDPAEVCARCNVSFIESDSEFAVTFLGRDYRIAYPEFSVRAETPEEGFMPLIALSEAQLLVMRYLIEGRYIQPLGTFLTFREMPWGAVYTTTFDGRCIKRLAFGFGGKPEALEKAMMRIGAVTVKTGDFGYEFELLPGLKIQFILWQADDEFPPSAQILFSDNFSMAFTAEDMAVVGDVTITTAKALSV
jgi:hypothetical protein